MYLQVVVDEVHERSVESDLFLACLKELLEADPSFQLHVLVMSASFDDARFGAWW